MSELRIESREILASRLPSLEASVAELNKRAIKLGVPELKLNVVRRWERQHKHELSGVEWSEKFVEVELIGESPCLNGWELIARISPLGNGENLVANVPGKSCPAEFREVSLGRCDHCHVVRKRNDVFVLRHESGEHKVVGRQCLSDFLGNVDPTSLLNRAEFLQDVVVSLGEDWGEGGFQSEPLVDPLKFLSHVSIFIRRFGWVPRSAAWCSDPTANAVWFFLTPRSRKDEEDCLALARKYDLKVNEQDQADAEKALQWAARQNGENDYLYNLGVACRQEFVTYKTAGLVASALPAYRRSVELELQAKADSKTSEWVGEIGKRQGFEGLLVRSNRVSESQYGVTTLVVFVAPNGSILKWWASGDVSQIFRQGERYDVTATPKKFNDWEGVKETLINRVTQGLPAKKGRGKKAAAEKAVKSVEVHVDNGEVPF